MPPWPLERFAPLRGRKWKESLNERERGKVVNGREVPFLSWRKASQPPRQCEGQERGELHDAWYEVRSFVRSDGFTQTSKVRNGEKVERVVWSFSQKWELVSVVGVSFARTRPFEVWNRRLKGRREARKVSLETSSKVLT
ncbi:MAG: hypothetical protein ACTS4U_00685 [Candidatus Hodgkinia cicadicola]